MIATLTLNLFGRDVFLLVPPDTVRKGYYLFLHGSLLSPDDYTLYLREVAEAGYVVVAPKYRMHIFANVVKYRDEALRILDSVKSIYGEGEACVGGHSMGAYVGLRMLDRFRCGVFLSLYVPLGPLGDVPDSVKVPILLFSGGRDALTPYRLYQMPVFRRGVSDRALILIPEATHNAYINGPVWGDFMAGWPPFGQKRFYDYVGRATARFLDGHIRPPSRE